MATVVKALLMVGLCSLACQGVVSAKHPSVLVRQLGTTADPNPTATLHELFQVGADALPYLTTRFGDKTPYYGLCGSEIKESSFYIDVPDDFLDGTNLTPEEKDAFREHRDANPEPPDLRPLTNEEVSLYLAVAILEGDLFFSNYCYIESAGAGTHEALGTALEEIAEILAHHSGDSNATKLKTIKAILEKYDLRFFDGYEPEKRPGEVGIRQLHREG
jgi:hypothetical protein